ALRCVTGLVPLLLMVSFATSILPRRTSPSTSIPRQQRPYPQQLGALLAALALAIVIALGITTGAFVLSFAVQRDLARQALLLEHLTWIFPAIVDSAILGATIAIVIISKLNMNKRDRGFYIALAVSVVVISILGNAYHAYHAAIAAQESIGGGGDLGFIPLTPAIAAAIAIIPPTLVLAFTPRNHNPGEGSRIGVRRLPFDRRKCHRQ
ncbi:DUF2637 domain-containing protein, partial [Rhodococcus qingshengii]|uniref:DUF2637 domain-containing protein n=2 Tax=Nocardiaceae TaxID=85025 RepID=UPI00355BA3FB